MQKSESQSLSPPNENDLKLDLELNCYCENHKASKRKDRRKLKWS